VLSKSDYQFHLAIWKRAAKNAYAMKLNECKGNKTNTASLGEK
jgi:hypothetical protein